MCNVPKEIFRLSLLLDNFIYDDIISKHEILAVILCLPIKYEIREFCVKYRKICAAVF